MIGAAKMMMGAGGGLRPQDVFATTLYAGSGGAQSINTGLNMPLSGGLVWIKGRTTSGYDHVLRDTLRGASSMLSSNAANGAATSNEFTGFTSTGFSLGSVSTGLENSGGQNYVSWSFRRAAKFFDIVTYTGNSVSGRQIAHSLGVAPGMVIVKRLDSTASWFVYHIASGANNYASLNETQSFQPYSYAWNNTAPTSTAFTVGGGPGTNDSGATFVAYLFAHDPDPSGIVQCGIVASSGTVTLGWRPQYLMMKPTAAGSWYVVDTARGLVPGSSDMPLFANASGAEITANVADLTATGFTNSVGVNMTYLAIREPI